MNIPSLTFSNTKDDDKTKTILNYSENQESRPYIDSSLSVTENKNREEKAIFVDKIPFSSEKSEILKTYKKFGKIIKFWMKNADSITQNLEENFKSCYIMFEKKENAQKAIENGTNLEINGVKVITSLPNETDLGTKRSIFAANFDFDLNEAQLSDFFNKFGEIVQIRIIRDRYTNKSKGICFIKFKLEESVLKAVKADNTNWQGKRIKIVRNAKNAEKVLKLLQIGMVVVKTEISAEDLQELKEQMEVIIKAKEIEETNYGITMMENLIQHKGKVPSSIIGKRIKKLKRGNFDEATLTKKITKAKESALSKLNKEVFEKDNLLQIRRDKRNAKARNNKMKVRLSGKGGKKV